MDFFSRDQLVQVLVEAKGVNLSGCNHERMIGISVAELWMGKEACGSRNCKGFGNINFLLGGLACEPEKV